MHRSQCSSLAPTLLPIYLLRIRIRIVLGLYDPDPLVRAMDPAPDPSTIKQK
jgi:hypothetical protein